jgi:hypothetical protein
MAGAWTLIRTIDLPHADDTDWVAAATPPATGTMFSLPAVNGQVAGGMKLAWVLLDSDSLPVAPAGTYNYRLIEVVDAAHPAGLNYATAAVVGAGFGSEVYLASQPGAGAIYALRVYSVAATPVTATQAQLWVKGTVV